MTMKQIPLITAWTTGNELPPKRSPEDVKRITNAIRAVVEPPPKRQRQRQPRQQHEECKTCAFGDGWCDSGDVGVDYKCPSRIQRPDM